MHLIRTLSEEDLCQQLADLLNKHSNLAKWRSAIDIKKSDVSYVVETHGRFLIGACGVHQQSPSISEVKNLVVLPHWRGKGLGKFLVGTAMQEAQTPLLYATIRKDNLSSLAVFQSLGFKVVEEYPAQDHSVILATKANDRWPKSKRSRFR